MGWTPGQPLILTKAVAAALPFIRGAVAAKLGGTATYRLLQSLGVGGRKKTVLASYKAMKHAYSDPGVYLPADSSKRPDPRFVPLNTFRQSKKWAYIVPVRIYNTLDSVLITKNITIASRNLRSVDSVIELAEAWAARYPFLESVQFGESYIESLTYSENPIYG